MKWSDVRPVVVQMVAMASTLAIIGGGSLRCHLEAVRESESRRTRFVDCIDRGNDASWCYDAALDTGSP